MSDEEFKRWVNALPDDPVGCIACGAIAGCCKDYPNCPGNPEWNRNNILGEDNGNI